MNVQFWHGLLYYGQGFGEVNFVVRAKVNLEIEGQEGAQANLNIAL